MADHGGGLMGGFGIGNYESAEQLAKDLATFPAAGLCTMKVYPLVGFEVLEKFVDAQLQALPKK